jgi:hypothetical protein
MMQTTARFRSVVRRAAIGLAASSLVGGAVVLASAVPAGAVTHIRYVSSYGSDVSNNCTVASTPCLTLLHAYNEAANGDTISLAGGTYKGTNLLHLTKNISIVGTSSGGSLNTNTTTISAEGQDRALETFGTITISNVVINDAITGQIANDGTLTLDNVVLGWSTESISAANSAQGLYNLATVTMNGGAIEGNTAALAGGGLFNTGTATFKNVSFSHNTVTDSDSEGGGIFNCSGTVHLTGSTSLHNNSAGEAGGGVETLPGATTTSTAGVVNSSNSPDDSNNTNPAGIVC